MENKPEVQILYLRQMRYPQDSFDSYYITAEEVDSVLQKGMIPEIRLAQDVQGATAAVIMAVERHPDREEPDYYIPHFYVDALLKYGIRPVFVGFDKTTEQLENIKPRAVFLVGGDFKFPDEWAEKPLAHGGDLRREQAYEACIRYAKQYRWPVLGICGGEQVLAGMHGAKLTRVEGHRNPIDNYSHEIQIAENSLLHHIYPHASAQVNSNHFDAVSSQNLGECKAVATTSDGTVEAIELKHPWHWFILGLQWHPERFYAKEDLLTACLFEKFALAVRGGTMIDEREQSFASAGMVEITDPHFIVDMIYAKPENLSGQPVYAQIGLGQRAFVRKELWERLQKVIPWLDKHQLKMKICDAFRPIEAHMALKKAINEEGGGIFASRAAISKHCHGTAIDVALTDLSGRELPYPTPVDCYKEELAQKVRKGDTKDFYEYCKQCRHDYHDSSLSQEIANRDQLRELMESAGFQSIVQEWWHYEMPDEFNFNFPIVIFK
ncbi:MAG: hypothetical protein E7018_01990 [Alphaproteobacteria bacterium]|nr:hypothetical protein [Alphaproteobacteria bacterium]